MATETSTAGGPSSTLMAILLQPIPLPPPQTTRKCSSDAILRPRNRLNRYKPHPWLKLIGILRFMTNSSICSFYCRRLKFQNWSFHGHRFQRFESSSSLICLIPSSWLISGSLFLHQFQASNEEDEESAEWVKTIGPNRMNPVNTGMRVCSGFHDDTAATPVKNTSGLKIINLTAVRLTIFQPHCSESLFFKPNHDDVWDVEVEDEQNESFFVQDDSRDGSKCTSIGCVAVDLIVPEKAVKEKPAPLIKPQVSLEDEDIVKAVFLGKIPSYSLQDKLGDCKRAAAIQRESLQRILLA